MKCSWEEELYENHFKLCVYHMNTDLKQDDCIGNKSEGLTKVNLYHSQMEEQTPMSVKHSGFLQCCPIIDLFFSVGFSLIANASVQF